MQILAAVNLSSFSLLLLAEQNPSATLKVIGCRDLEIISGALKCDLSFEAPKLIVGYLLQVREPASFPISSGIKCGTMDIR